MVVVAIVFRNKQSAKSPQTIVEAPDSGSLSVRTVTYGILAVLIIISATIFVFKYRADNRIIDIKVIAEDGISTIYQARQKSIKGRQFLTLDGRQVTLGESDRIEMGQ